MAPRPGLIALVLCLSGPAAAQLGSDPVLPDPQRAALPLGIDGALALPGSLRLAATLEPGVKVASDDPQVPEAIGDEVAFEARLRFRPALVLQTPKGLFRLWRAAADGELHVAVHEAAFNQALDPIEEARAAAPEFRLTQAYLFAQGEHLAMQLGLVRAHFGLGLLANGGEDAPLGPSRQSPFGYGRQGDRVARISVYGLPQGIVAEPDAAPRAPIAVALAADAIIDDDQARWTAGDRAWQVLSGVFASPKNAAIGAGAAYRHQTHADGGETTVTIVLVSARGDLPVAGGPTLFAHFEGAGYLGETDYVSSAARRESLRIQSAGGALRLGAEEKRWIGMVEAGLASGDSNPFDAELHGFTFDRDYRVGLLLFGPATRQITAQAAYNVADPRLRATPTRGFDRLATGGAVTNARYLNPRGSYTLVKGMTVHLGYLLALTDEPYADPFFSGLQGGGGIGPRGAKDAGVYGHELDIGLDYGAFGDRLRARMQAAWAQLGDVFADIDGASDSIFGVQLQIEGRW